MTRQPYGIEKYLLRAPRGDQPVECPTNIRTRCSGPGLLHLSIARRSRPNLNATFRFIVQSRSCEMKVQVFSETSDERGILNLDAPSNRGQAGPGSRRTLTHPGDKVTVNVGDPKLVVDKTQTTRIDEARGHQLEGNQPCCVTRYTLPSRLSGRVGGTGASISPSSGDEFARRTLQRQRRDRHPGWPGNAGDHRLGIDLAIATDPYDDPLGTEVAEVRTSGAALTSIAEPSGVKVIPVGPPYCAVSTKVCRCRQARSGKSCR